MFFAPLHPFFSATTPALPPTSSATPPGPSSAPVPMTSQKVLALASTYLSICLMALSEKACASTRLFRPCSSLSRVLCVLDAGCTKAS